ncbi:hypothetical protein PVK06_027073 [Gossypium arboreum]|uniref:Uncharacterized protein n=1 Tax=Gossypium arboreum TaxID=29729 RepID=A0ABR0NZF4_GOSAR|nr:hypothetical protein PVK06_027073 [Gossypium arboreum]
MFTNHHVQSQYSPMVISDNNSSAGCPERGMKSRIKVDFQTVFVQGSPPLIPNRAPKKLHLCHIQFRKMGSSDEVSNRHYEPSTPPKLPPLIPKYHHEPPMREEYRGPSPQ